MTLSPGERLGPLDCLRDLEKPALKSERARDGLRTGIVCPDNGSSQGWALRYAVSFFHNLGQNFRVVSNLETDDPAIVLGRVFHDIREIAIYGQEQAIQLMCFLNDRRIQRICCQMFAQAKYFASCRGQGVNDRSGNAMVGEEPQRHQVGISSSARSRA